MTARRLAATAAVAALMLVGTAAAPAGADDVAEFYRDRTVTVMVPSSLGASLGLYGRLLVDHIGKHIPGTPTVIIQSQPGAGGTKGAAFAYNAAPKDGTYIAEVLAPSVLAPVLRSVKFDARRFQWLGSITTRPSVVSVWHTAPATTLDGAKKVEVVMGSTGLGSETYLVPTLMNEVLGTRFKVVKGYKGGAEINKAMEIGEVHGRMNYWSGWTTVKQGWLDSRQIVHLVQYGPKIPELKDVPSLGELAATEDARKMVRFIEVSEYVGIGFWVAPEVPAERVAALRAAFDATMKDPAFLADAKSRKAPVDPIGGVELQKIVADGLDVPPALVAKMKAVFGFK